MANLAHEMADEINAKELAKREKVSVRAIGIPYAKLRAQGHPLFASQFDCNAPLSPEQIAILRPGKLQVNVPKKIKAEAVAHSANIAMNPEQGRPNEVAPQGVGLNASPKKVRSFSQKAVLAGVCVFCAVASISNMLDISTQIKDSFAVACVLTSIFTLAPFAVFYADVKPGVSWLVSGICIGYEVFCNTVGTYKGLANLGRGVPYEVWEPGGFIDSISRVTTIEARPCALVVSGVMAAIIASLFLLCLNELKK